MSYHDKPPIPGLTITGTVTRLKDADTFEVEVRRIFSVRVDNLKAAEQNTKEGQDATAFASTIISPGDKVLLFIPSHDNEEFMDFNSFARVVAEVWIDNQLYGAIIEKADHGDFDNCRK